MTTYSESVDRFCCKWSSDGVVERTSFKDGLIWSPLRASSYCIEFGTGVARSIEMVFGILFSSIDMVCDVNSMIPKAPCIFDISLL